MSSIAVDLGSDNDARLVRLRTALSLGAGFQLVIVEAEPGAIRAEVLRRVATWSADRAIGPLARVVLDSAAGLTSQLAGGTGHIVTGLEPPDTEQAPARDWIAELNWSRDALPALVPGPLVLVVSQRMHRAVFERAPDLYSWRRHTTRIVVSSLALSQPLTSPCDPYWRRVRDLWEPDASDGSLDPALRAHAIVMLAQARGELGDAPGAAAELQILPGLLDSMRTPLQWRRLDGLGLVQDHEVVRIECALLRGDLEGARHLLKHGYLEAPEPGRVRLLRAVLLAAEGSWDQAIADLAALIAASSELDLARIPRARACLCQIAFARGDLTSAVEHARALAHEVTPYLDAWGLGLVLQLAEAVAALYPDAIASIGVFDPAVWHAATGIDARVAIGCLRAERECWLGRIRAARAALASAETAELEDENTCVRARLALCRGRVALASGEFDDAVAAALDRACARLRVTDPRQAAICGMLLGALWHQAAQPERSVVAYQAAAADAHRAGDPALALEAELGELAAAVPAALERDDAADRLDVLADQLHAGGRTQAEGLARRELARCLARRGRHEAVRRALDRARECFAATTDADSERSVNEMAEPAR